MEFRMKDCPECDGHGEVLYEVPVPMSNSNPYGDFEERWCECGNCFGSGQIVCDDEEWVDGPE